MSPTPEMYPYLTMQEFERYRGEGKLEEINSYKKNEYDERIKNYSLNRLHQKRGIPSHYDKDLHIAILGKTGDGKSSLANAILGRDCFRTSQSSKSFTKISSKDTCTHGKRRLIVVDTPGIHDTEQDVSTTMSEIIRWAFLLRRGVHCFIICMNASEHRFKKETQEFLKLITQKEEDVFLNYCMLVYTNAESALNDCSLDKFIKSKKDHEVYARFMDAIEYRVVAANVTTKIPAEQQRNRDVIIAMADRLVDENTKCGLKELYTNKVIREAGRLHNKIATLVEKNDCHPILVDAAVESYIKCLDEEPNIFKEKVLELLMKSQECKLDDNTKALIFNCDGEEVVITRDLYEKHIRLIYYEMCNFRLFFIVVVGLVLSQALPLLFLLF